MAESTRWSTPIVLGGVGVALTAASVTLDLSVTASERDATGTGLGSYSAAVGLVVLACALPVLAHHARHVVGWVLAGTGLLWVTDGLADSWSGHGLTTTPQPALTGFSIWYVAQFGAFLLVALPLLLVVYPDGRLPTGRWRWVAVLAVLMATALPALLVFGPLEALERDDPLPAPTGMPQLPVDPDLYYGLLVGARVLTLLAVPLAVAVVFARHRNATDLDRVRFRWLIWAGVVSLMCSGLLVLVPQGPVATAALVVCLAVTGVSVAVGILRPTLTDVDALMGGTLVYAGVAAVVVALDALLLAGLDRLLGNRLDQRQVGLLVLLGVLAVYGPLRTRLTFLVRRLLVGRRGDRYEVVSGLAARLEESSDVRTQLPQLAAAVAEAFKLDYVRVEVFAHGGGTTSATHGADPTEIRQVPLRYGSEDVGRLWLSARGVRSMLSGRDRALLLDVVRQAAVAVRSSRLADDLQTSRERLVLAREEDRRRIRRDLHDGLGPVLGGIAMRLEAVGNAWEDDPDFARGLLATSRREVTEALADVRRLVHGLRPPALDDVGLVGALRQQADRAESALDVSVDAAELPGLSAAVEVAAFRIASEGLTNVLRHAHATTCVVRLARAGTELLVEVSDDGCGIEPETVAGVGLLSIRERAEELGGRAAITQAPQGGTRVRAWLPLGASTGEGDGHE